MGNIEESKIIDDLIAVNLGAVTFYKDAAEKTHIPHLEESFHKLERLHTDIVTDLAIAAHRNGNTFMDLDHHGSSIFSSLNVYPPMNAIQKIENCCSQALKSAIESEELSIDLKMHVFGAVSALERTQAYILALTSRQKTH